MTEETRPRYYITTPIYYVNGLPHVGSALTTISCDVLARYHRMRGFDTWFLTGTDENATKVQEAAEKAGVPTQAFVDNLASAFQECWRGLHIENDDFIRTTDPRHVRAVQEFFRLLQERDYVYLDTYEGWYSVSDETFFADSEVENGIAIESGKPVVRTQEQNYFFRLSAFGDRLLKHIEENPEFLQPEFRRNEVIGFIHEGLRDMSISRPYRGWGIRPEGDPNNYIYVWFDALINYLAACGWPDDPKWTERWPADVHFMGKEIFVRFHATLWPAMLMALDMPLPRTVYAHGWWTVQGAKGGKTGASLPHPARLTALLAARSGADLELAADAQRYLLCREMNYGPDTEFSVENCLRRFNTDLANDLGNLLNRTLNMVNRYFDGVVPAPESQDAEVAALALQVVDEYSRALAEFKLNTALEVASKLVARMNKYIDEKAPWALAKKAAAGDAASGEALALTLGTCLEAIRVVSVLVSPYMPVAAAAIRSQLGLGDSCIEPAWIEAEWGRWPAGTRVSAPAPLFPRIQDLTVDDATRFALGSSSPAPAEPAALEEGVERVESNEKTGAPAPGTPIAPAATEQVVETISIDDLMKVQLRVGEILAAEPVPNATKLLRLTVQIGDDDTRTILAGIAEYYQPETLIGRLVVVVANLAPRKMRGIESQGMLLAADVDGRAILLQPDSAVPSGAKVR